MIPLSRTESYLVFFTAIKYPFYVLPQTAMTDFPNLFYKSASETPTFSYTGILKKVPLWALGVKQKSPLLIYDVS